MSCQRQDPRHFRTDRLRRSLPLMSTTEVIEPRKRRGDVAVAGCAIMVGYLRALDRRA